MPVLSTVVTSRFGSRRSRGTVSPGTVATRPAQTAVPTSRDLPRCLISYLLIEMDRRLDTEREEVPGGVAHRRMAAVPPRPGCSRSGAWIGQQSTHRGRGVYGVFPMPPAMFRFE
jgi:hypothetical protein